jgi:hypothetical protein
MESQFNIGFLPEEGITWFCLDISENATTYEPDGIPMPVLDVFRVKGEPTGIPHQDRMPPSATGP